MAEISMGAGIQPIRAMIKPSAAMFHGEGSIKSGFICMPLAAAIAAAATVVMLRLTTMNFDSVSKALYCPISRISTHAPTTATDSVPTDSVRPGTDILTIAAVSRATAPVLMVDERKHITRNTQR